MNKKEVIELKKRINELSEKEKKARDLYIKKVASCDIYGPMTGYSSIDKPWLKNYPDNIIKSDIPKMNIYEYLNQCTKDNKDSVALDYVFVSITYKELFEKIDKVANSLVAMGIKEGDTVTSCIPNMPEAIYLIFAVAKIGARIDLIDPLTNAELLKKYCDNCNSKLFFTVDTMSKSAIKNLERCQYSKVITVSPTESLPMPNATERKMKYNDNVISWSTFINNGKNTDSKRVIYKENLPFAILHTGGTTGVPKGAMLSHDNMNSFAYQLNASFSDLKISFAAETQLSLPVRISSISIGFVDDIFEY